jgi:hypothetical protein
LAHSVNKWARGKPISAAGVRIMKNITVSVPDEIYIDARVWAARRGISVSAMVKLFLDHFSDDPEGIVEILEELPLGPFGLSP